MNSFDLVSEEIGKCLLSMRAVADRKELNVEEMSGYDKLYLQCALYIREYSRIAERDEESSRYRYDKKLGALFTE